MRSRGWKAGCGVLAVLLGAAGCWAGLGYLMMFWMFSGWYQEGAYVSNRPELTWNADAEQVREIDRKLGAFFKTHGLTRREAHGLQLASGVHYKHGLLFRFGISPRPGGGCCAGRSRCTSPRARS